MTNEIKCIPSRFWYKSRNRMYEVHGRFADTLEIWIKESNKLILVDESEGVRMDFTGRRDHNGDDIYGGDILVNLYTNQKYEVLEIEGIHCLATNNMCIDGNGLPFDMSMYEIRGNIYADPKLRVNK